MASLEIIISVFLLLTFITVLLSQWLKIPRTVILVLIGTIAIVVLTALSLYGGSVQGAAADIVSQIRSLYDMLVQGEGGGLFVGLILPPLLFEAMIHIRSDDLRCVLRPSLALATVGVIIATVVGGLILWLGLGLSPYVAFLFSALIAPTDVVTVLEVFKRVKVPSKLATLMETESGFNDAPAIVIFTVILSLASLQQVTFWDATYSFAYTFIVGTLVGLGVAFVGEVLSSLFVDNVSEIVLAIVVVYGSYALATGIGASGLVAVSVAGLYYGNFTMRNAMAQAERESVKIFWQIIAFLGNTVAFLLIGFQANLISLPQSLVLIMVAYAAVLIGRAATVYPIMAFFKNKMGEKTSIVWSHIAMLGGVRGAVSIVLAATITVSAAISQSDINMIQTMVFGVAFISIMIQVPILFRYAKKKLAQSEDAKTSLLHKDFEGIEKSIKEVNALKTEGKISNDEFQQRLESIRRELEDVICASGASLQTKEIIQARASALFATLPKIPLANHVLKETKKKRDKK